ncbi:SPX domain-containing membrane protein [Gossypium australe]|uniref:SPX domain-containing membrane protein n=1 Tax=Gossypium australe TaxID=47621 RepID=A0A5B6WFT3_9ROSI|nr:SPX domain-containing membrane protein [Gossypium australe]
MNLFNHNSKFVSLSDITNFLSHTSAQTRQGLNGAMDRAFNGYMHYVGFVDTEDMNALSGKRKYSSLLGYISSKLAQVRFCSSCKQALYQRLCAT